MAATLFTAFLAAAVSLAVAFLAPTFIKWRDEQFKMRKLLIAFRAEIEVILELIDQRQYIGHLEALSNLSVQRNTPQFVVINLKVEHYTKIYEKHLEDVAMLPEAISQQIIRFYMLITAIADDIFIYSGQSAPIILSDYVSALSKDVQMLHRAVFIGNDVCSLIAKEAKEMRSRSFTGFLINKKP